MDKKVFTILFSNIMFTLGVQSSLNLSLHISAPVKE